MTSYTVSGHAYDSVYFPGSRWAWAVVRSESDSDEVVKVNSGTAPYRWLAVLEARWYVALDRARQRRKNKPIYIHLGGKK